MAQYEDANGPALEDDAVPKAEAVRKAPEILPDYNQPKFTPPEGDP
ncbi:MAG TPA: hypothetical protein VES66_08070 [Terriglobales bacterium]|nr:hypothetical protein [Terriglobales bacterium]